MTVSARSPKEIARLARKATRTLRGWCGVSGCALCRKWRAATDTDLYRALGRYVRKGRIIRMAAVAWLAERIISSASVAWAWPRLEPIDPDRYRHPVERLLGE